METEDWNASTAPPGFLCGGRTWRRVRFFFLLLNCVKIDLFYRIQFFYIIIKRWKMWRKISYEKNLHSFHCRIPCLKKQKPGKATSASEVNDANLRVIPDSSNCNFSVSLMVLPLSHTHTHGANIYTQTHARSTNVKSFRWSKTQHVDLWYKEPLCFIAQTTANTS